MKYKITYEYDAMNAPHFFAFTEINGTKQYSSGRSWGEARSRHMDKLEDLARVGNVVPPPEKVEI